MERFMFKKIMQAVGEVEGLSAEEIEREMQIAIDSGFDNPDEKIRKEWTKVPFKGERPMPQEVIEYLYSAQKM